MTGLLCSLCGKETMDTFGSLCFECAMAKKSLQQEYPAISETTAKCFGCGYFNVGVMEELCSHPLKNYPGYPNCWVNESKFHVDKEGYWALGGSSPSALKGEVKE